MTPEEAALVVLGVHAGRVPAGTEALLAGARLIAGGREVLATLAPDGAERLVLGADLDAALNRIAAAPGPTVVLASGDPGFFGIVRRLRDVLGTRRLAVHPAPSSVAVAFGRLGLPWDDAVVVSAHGRAPQAALAAALAHPKVAILTGPDTPPQFFAAGLRGTACRLAVAERLGFPEERMVEGTPEELAAQTFAEPNVLLVLTPAAVPATSARPAAPPRSQATASALATAPGSASAVSREPAPGARITAFPPRTPTAWALPEAAFAHRDGMITKAEVRALALARLGPGLGDLVWDVGCGSASVGVECARLGAAVIAVDHDAGAVALARENAQAHGTSLQVVHGQAPGALEPLPDPDCAFVGGGGADLDAILELCAARARRAVVVTLALVDRVAPALERLAAAGLEVDAVQLQASRVLPLAGGHRLAAQNPVFVLCGIRR